MARIENVKVYGMEDSFRASKFPFKSDLSNVSEEITDVTIKMAKCPIGEGHDNYLNGVIVQFDLYCEQCGDSDSYIGEADTREEAYELLKDDYDEEYLNEFLKDWES